MKCSMLSYYQAPFVFYTIELKLNCYYGMLQRIKYWKTTFSMDLSQEVIYLLLFLYSVQNSQEKYYCLKKPNNNVQLLMEKKRHANIWKI